MPSFRPYTTRCITLRGRHLHLYAWGAEQPDPAATLFCLHGWGDLGASFQFVVDALPQDWCILAPDWRGFGRSAHNDGPYWFPDYLADLDALLEALSPSRPATLVGHSLGGYWALKMSLAHQIPCVIANPSLQPNFREDYPAICDEDLDHDIPQLAYLELGDEILDMRAAQEQLEDYMQIQALEGGHHRLICPENLNGLIRQIEQNFLHK